jgi:hypothetical protein
MKRRTAATSRKVATGTATPFAILGRATSGSSRMRTDAGSSTASLLRSTSTRRSARSQDWPRRPPSVRRSSLC